MSTVENQDRSIQFSSDELEFSIEHEAAEDVIELIAATKYGVDGGLRYSHQNTRQRIANLHDPDFLVIRKEGKAIGTSTYCKRPLELAGNSCTGHYIRYFSVAAEHRGKRTGSIMMQHADEHYRKSTNPAVFYAYIELENIRSLKVSDAHHLHRLGKFETVFFSRFFPKAHASARRIQATEKEALQEKLNHEYRNHAFVHWNRLFTDDNYYVLEENGEIVAGVQVNPVGWVFEQVPGFSGWFLLNVLPKIPILGRLFNPNDFRFTAFEGIYCPEGNEQYLVQLMEHVLHAHGHYTGMLWLDRRDPMLQRIKSYGKLGLMGKVQSSPPASIVCEFSNIPQEDIPTWMERPAYISAFDLT